ncbi:hypothetical protein AERYTH_07630 [Aeromicrobium erythreum]|uniref:Uncharacterized protein n=1 Tax=Aeromicrobium erythreum TaxID=2041 RepID=A0A0U4C931_9ACTN|nr:hypothetical protein AERYTH_07630 [Aeromicrobium erythreum]
MVESSRLSMGSRSASAWALESAKPAVPSARVPATAAMAVRAVVFMDPPEVGAMTPGCWRVVSPP